MVRVCDLVPLVSHNVKLDLVVFEFTDTRAQTWIFAANLVGFPVGNVRCASNDMNQSQHIGGITA